MFRRYGTETLRLIQFKEIELDLLARKIDAIDQRDDGSLSTGHRLDSIEHHVEWPTELVDNLELFEHKIKIYCKAIFLCVSNMANDPQMTWS